MNTTISTHVIRTVFLAVIVGCVQLAAHGETIPVDSVHVKLIREIAVPAREQGVLDAVQVKEGAIVEAGDLLAQIADDEARLALSKAKLDLELALTKAKADHDVRAGLREHEVALKNLERAKGSVAKFERSVSPAEMDKFRLLVDQSKIAIERAQHTLKLAELEAKSLRNDVETASQRLDRHNIVARFPGMVAEINRFSGEWVEPGETVFRMIRVDQLKAEGFVNATDIKSDLRGMPVELTVDTVTGEQQTYKGKVVFVSAEVEPVSRQSRMWAEIDNKDQRLKPGLPARMRIIVKP